MTEEKPSYREKREQLNNILSHMLVPRRYFYALNEAEKYLDKSCPSYLVALKLIEEFKINVQVSSPQTISQ